MSRSYCRGLCKKPGTVRVGARETTQWFFETSTPFIPQPLQRFSMTERCLDAGATFEDLGVAFERACRQC